MFDCFVTDLIIHTAERTRDAAVQTLNDVRRHPKRLVAFSDEVETEQPNAGSSFTTTCISVPNCCRKNKGLSALWRSYLSTGWLARRTCRPAYQEKAALEPLPRVICDYIAGMTDNYILEQHGRMCR